MKQMILTMGIAGIIAVAITGCRKDVVKNLSAEESRIYITNHDSAVNFSTFKTFSIADSAGVIEDNQGRGRELTDYDAAVISAVKASMAARGYQLVSRDQQPDLGINVSRVYSNSVGVVSYPGYWNDYGSFYDPFYWGYGGYNYYDPTYYGAGYYGYYQVTQGALTIDMLNLRDAKNDNTIRPVWSALARGEGVFGVGNVQTQIAAFFEQSPYLTTN